MTRASEASNGIFPAEFIRERDFQRRQVKHAYEFFIIQLSQRRATKVVRPRANNQKVDAQCHVFAG